MIHEGKTLRQNVTLRPDALVIGSGAGGAVAAARLAAAGMKVCVVEEGGHHTRRDFTPHEGEMFPLLYQEHGNRATADQGIMILQGRALGGGTTINWTASFRTPPQTLAHWQRHHGAAVSEENLRPHFESVERRLNIHPDPDNVNKNNDVLLRGCKKLGWEAHLVPRNVKDCESLGICGLGCPVDARLSMHLTYLPDAERAGAVIYTNARAERIEVQGDRVKRVVCAFLDEDRDQPNGFGLTVEPRRCILAAGAINSPLLLLRSRIADPAGLVGRRTFFHTVIALMAVFDEQIDGFRGAPLTVHCHRFAYPEDGSMGYFLECPEIQPMLTAVAMPGFGATHRRHMEALRHTAAGIILTKDGFNPEERGATVTLKSSGYPKIDYHYTPRLYDAFRRGLKSMAQIQLAAGAREVRLLHEDPVAIRSERDLAQIDKLPFGPGHMIMFAAHQMGGCQMGADPKTGVVRPDLRHHQLENLWILDGAVLPTSVGANPQETIFGLASWGAAGIVKAG